MITHIETVEAVQDPSDASRNRKKFLGEGLTFEETGSGVTATSASGRAIFIPWSNVAFAVMATKPTIVPEAPAAPPVLAVFPKPAAVVPEKRGPGRPPKAR